MNELNPAFVVAGCLILGVLLVGTILCAVRMNQPGAVKKCYASFILFASGWLLCGAISALGKSAGHEFAASLGGLLLFLVCAVAAVILAILGLSEVRRAGPSAAGRAPAVTTLVLAGLAVCILGGAFAFGVLKGLQGPPGIAPPGAIATFDDLRFSIQPPEPWVRVDASKFNPNATVMFRHPRPEAYVMVIAERIESGDLYDLESLGTGVRKNLEAVSRSVRVVSEADEAVNGLAGRRLLYDVDFQGTRQAYLCWVHIAPDRVFQLIAWGEHKNSAVVLALSRKAFDSFTLLPPK